VTLATEDNKSLSQLCRRVCAIILWRVGQTAEKKSIALKECSNVKWHEQDNTVSFEIPANLVKRNSTDGKSNVAGEYFLSFEYKERRDGFNQGSTMESDPCKINVLPGSLSVVYSVHVSIVYTSTTNSQVQRK